MRVAIIDDGISTKAIDSWIDNYAVENNDVKPINASNISPFSHGSICAKIIKKYAHNNISLVGVQVLNEDDEGMIDDLVIALNWCLENDISVINISCGVSGQVKTNELLKACQRLNRAGVTIVAAQNNNGALTYPACFPCVISVEQRNYQTNYIDWYRISDIYAEGEHELKHEETTFYSLKCNSFACAYACALIINQVLNNNCVKLTMLPKDVYVAPFTALYDFSFLSDVKVLANPENTAKPFSLGCETDESPQNTTLVILPSDKITKHLVEEHFKQSNGSLSNVIWCGKRIPNYLKKWCAKHNVRFWDEQIDRSKIYTQERTQPCVLFTGEEKIVDQTIQTINNRFSLDRYKTLLISDYAHSYLYGYKKVYRKSNLDLYAYHYDPDVILYKSKRTSIATCDISVVCNEKKFEVSCNSSKQIVNDTDLLYTLIFNSCS